MHIVAWNFLSHAKPENSCKPKIIATTAFRVSAADCKACFLNPTNWNHRNGASIKCGTMRSWVRESAYESSDISII